MLIICKIILAICLKVCIFAEININDMKNNKMTVGKWVYELSLIPGLLLVYAMLSIIDGIIRGFRYLDYRQYKSFK